MSKRQGQYLRRYTSLEWCKQILNDQQLSLLDLGDWDDINDKFLIDLYREKSGYTKVLALCFTMSTETHHHWKCYGHGDTPSGCDDETVCIEFNRQALEKHVAKVGAIRSGEVEYLLVRQLKALPPPPIDRLPFIKRDGFSDEREWRLITGVAQVAASPTIPFDLASINRIILNPTFPQERGVAVRAEIKKISGCDHMSVQRSHLTNSKLWKDAAKRLVGDSTGSKGAA